MFFGFGDCSGNGGRGALERYRRSIGNVEWHLVGHCVERIRGRRLLRAKGGGAEQGCAHQGCAKQCRGQGGSCGHDSATPCDLVLRRLLYGMRWPAKITKSLPALGYTPAHACLPQFLLRGKSAS